MKLIMAVVKRVNELMYQKNWSGYKLSRKTGLTPAAIQKLMAGKTKDINLKTLVLLAQAFDMEISEFLDVDYFKLKDLDLE